MPVLKDLVCHVQWANTGAPFPEYGIQYGDGVVETYLAIPTHPQAFSIRLTSRKFIAEGLAMIVFIDGNYQCNRNRVNLQPHKKALPTNRSEIDFVVRQREKPMGDGTYLGREWRFDDYNMVTVLPKGVNEGHFDDLGSIEVLVLRCSADNSDETTHSTSSSAQDSAILSPDQGEPAGPTDDPAPDLTWTNAKEPVVEEDTGGGLMMGLFDGPADDPPSHYGHNGDAPPYDYRDHRQPPRSRPPYRPQEGSYPPDRPPSPESYMEGRPTSPRLRHHPTDPEYRDAPHGYPRPRRRVHFDYGIDRDEYYDPSHYGDRSTWRDAGRERLEAQHHNQEFYRRHSRPSQLEPYSDHPSSPHDSHYMYHPERKRYSDHPRTYNSGRSHAYSPTRPDIPLAPLPPYQHVPHARAQWAAHASPAPWQSGLPPPHQPTAWPPAIAPPFQHPLPMFVQPPSVPFVPAPLAPVPFYPAPNGLPLFQAQGHGPSTQGPQPHNTSAGNMASTTSSNPQSGWNSNENNDGNNKESGNDWNRNDSGNTDNASGWDNNDTSNNNEANDWSNDNNNNNNTTDNWDTNNVNNDANAITQQGWGDQDSGSQMNNPQNNSSWGQTEPNTGGGTNDQNTGNGQQFEGWANERDTSNSNNHNNDSWDNNQHGQTWGGQGNAPGNVNTQTSATTNQSGKRALYGPYGAYYTTRAFGDHEIPADAEEEPRYDVPENIARAKNISKQVQPGKGYLYCKKRCIPYYIDTFDEPYARFVFKYRTKDQLKREIGVELEAEPTGNEEVNALETLDKAELIQMVLRAKGALGGTIPDSTPRGPTPPTSVSLEQIPIEPPVMDYLKYKLPPGRNTSNVGLGIRKASGVLDQNGGSVGQQGDDWGNNQANHAQNPGDGGWSSADNNASGGGVFSGNAGKRSWSNENAGNQSGGGWNNTGATRWGDGGGDTRSQVNEQTNGSGQGQRKSSTRSQASRNTNAPVQSWGSNNGSQGDAQSRRSSAISPKGEPAQQPSIGRDAAVSEAARKHNEMYDRMLGPEAARAFDGITQVPPRPLGPFETQHTAATTGTGWHPSLSDSGPGPRPATPTTFPKLSPVQENTGWSSGLPDDQPNFSPGGGQAAAPKSGW